jgi:deferrochelatase/peroxidase EfeB
MKPVEVDFADVQGLVRYEYGRLKEACYFVANIKDPASARAWLANHKFTSAADSWSRDQALQVAFTFVGLQNLGISQQIQEGFPTDFRSGMTGDEARSRRLGDVGCNDPKKWIWGGPGNVPHVLIALFAKTRPELEALKTKIMDQLWANAFHEPSLCLPTSNMDDHEPFGFADGLSQPSPDWQRRESAHDPRKYTNISALGEFLLGYPNEYGLYTDRPLVSRKDDPKDILLPAEDAPDRKDFVRNGTYLVMRDLEQDVAGFWKYVEGQTGPTKGKPLAEAMVGRTMEGEPLVKERLSIPGVKDDDKPINGFTYSKEPNGTLCPFGAHIRRANPRTADLPDGTTWLSFLWRMFGFGGGSDVRYDLLESVRFHRILRRGREYGPPVTPEAALKEEVPPAGGRGLRFICLNANILRQFEFLQNSWIANPRFDGLEEADPLLGNRKKLCAGGDTDTFTWPQASGINRRYEGLPAFVTVHGGAYFFMPGLRALRYICNQ